MNDTTIPWDLCIVGTGIAGLNALHVAAEYLPEGARVLIIEKRDTIGGMWNTTYDHVRLHQPYSFFTVGDIPWELGREPSHLADRFEVLEHMRHCFKLTRERVDLHEWYGCSYLEHREELSEQGPLAVITATAADGERLEVRAHRFIKALGFNAWPDQPLSFASDQVRSITPESWDFFGPEMSADDAPIYIIGGGKTGVDAAYHAVKRYPGRKVVMMCASGTSFLNRDMLFPAEPEGKFKSPMMFDVMSDLANMFDGNNEDEVYDYFVKTYGMEFEDATSARCIFGILSAEEKRVIDRHVEVQNVFLVDVQDTPDGPVTVHRSGEQAPIEPKSWVVNCTGILLKGDPEPESVLSEHGAILTLTTGAAYTFLSSLGAYFLTHLWFQDLLGRVPVSVMDHRQLLRANPKAYMFASTTQSVYNSLLMSIHLPNDVLERCHLVFDRWYPAPRRLWAAGKLRLQRASLLKQLGETLSILDDKYNVARPVPARPPKDNQPDPMPNTNGRV